MFSFRQIQNRSKLQLAMHQIHIKWIWKVSFGFFAFVLLLFSINTTYHSIRKFLDKHSTGNISVYHLSTKMVLWLHQVNADIYCVYCTRGLYCKTFYGRNYCRNVISWSVCNSLSFVGKASSLLLEWSRVMCSTLVSS